MKYDERGEEGKGTIPFLFFFELLITTLIFIFCLYGEFIRPWVTCSLSQEKGREERRVWRACVWKAAREDRLFSLDHILFPSSC